MIRGNERNRRLLRRLQIIAGLMAGAETVEPAGAAEPPKLFVDPSFIDTRSMPRHAGVDLPPLIALGELATAEPLMPSKTPWPAEFQAQRRAVAGEGDLALSGGYQGNGTASTEAGVAHADTAEASIWAGLRHDHVKPYEDGAGQRVSYGYDRLNAHAAAQWRPAERTRLTTFVMRDSFDDNRIPSYGIDATRYDRYVASATAEHRPAGSVFNRVEAGLTHDLVSYDADNTTLRDKGGLGLAYKGLLTTTRGLARGEFDTGRFRNTLTADLGVQHHNIDIDALYPAQGSASHRMPEVETLQAGLSASTATRLSARDGLAAGLRLDASHADPNKRSHLPPVSGTGASSFQVTPAQLWQRYYGTTDSNPVVVNLSGRVMATRDTEDKTGRLHLDLRRAVRTPDAGERFYASSGPASATQVGNPQLDPEAHHRLEVGLRQDGGGFKGNFAPGNPAGSWRFAATAYGDRVVDFVTADRARGQPGILRNDGAVVYRNVEAYLAGATAEVWWQAADGWAARARLSWTRGENLTDSRPLYQIPPVDGEVVVEHRHEVAPDTVGSAGARLSFAASQNRIDSSTATGSGQDTAGATAGWALLDLFAGVAVGQRAALTAGIANVLDKHYHLHVNPLPQSPTSRLQWAPGRSAFVQATVSF
jgi:iron complex outermembrane receptor protein